MTTFDAREESFSKVNAVCLAEAASMAYQDPQKIADRIGSLGFSTEHFYQDKKTDTQAFIARNDKAMLLSFRGTEPKKYKDWESDLEVALTPALDGKVHHGFYEALISVWDSIVPVLRKNQLPLWVTGHSLGAAIATLAVAKLHHEEGIKAQGLYTFGQPRCGDKEFAGNFDKIFMQRTFRFVNYQDIVPKVPLESMHYTHVGNCKYFNKSGNLDVKTSWKHHFLTKLEDSFSSFFTGEVLSDHEIKNYLANTRKLVK
jgi:triacylglycerol lipase